MSTTEVDRSVPDGHLLYQFPDQKTSKDNRNTKKSRVFLFSSPRTGCHLLERMIQGQSGTAFGSHFTVPARFHQVPLMESGPIDEADATKTKELYDIWQGSYDKLVDFLKEADEKNVNVFYHEHTHFMYNPVIASTDVYGPSAKISPESWICKPHNTAISYNNTSTPYPIIYPQEFILNPRHKYILTIRDPLVSVPSGVRGIKDLEYPPNFPSKAVLTLSTQYRCQRLFYDWLVSKGHPVWIIDMDDYTVPSDSTSTAGKKRAEQSPTLKALVQEVGFNDEQIQTTWPAATKEQLAQMPPIVVAVLKDLLDSDGVFWKEKAGGLSLQKEKPKWVEEFGKEGAETVEEMWRKADVDYQYLYGKRFHVDGGKWAEPVTFSIPIACIM